MRRHNPSLALPFLCTCSTVELSSLLDQSGARLATPPTIVPFQDGRALAVPAAFAEEPPAAAGPAAPAPAPAPAAASGAAAAATAAASTLADTSGSGSSGGGISIGVVAGVAAAGALALAAVAAFVYWRMVLRPQRAALVASAASSMKKDSDGSCSNKVLAGLCCVRQHPCPPEPCVLNCCRPPSPAWPGLLLLCVRR